MSVVWNVRLQSTQNILIYASCFLFLFIHLTVESFLSGTGISYMFDWILCWVIVYLLKHICLNFSQKIRSHWSYWMQVCLAIRLNCDWGERVLVGELG